MLELTKDGFLKPQKGANYQINSYIMNNNNCENNYNRLLAGEKITECDLESEPDFLKEFDKEKYSALFNFLEGNKSKSDSVKIEEYKNTEDHIEHLRLLRKMQVSDAAACVYLFSGNQRSSDYLSKRLNSYQERVKPKKDVASSDQESAESEERISSNSEDIKLGLLRDMMYATMIGTQEMAMAKIATNNLRSSGFQSSSRKSGNNIRSVELKGYHSGIFYGEDAEDSGLGFYPNLRKLYEKCKDTIQRKFSDEELSADELEHKAVMLGVERLQKAVEYNKGTIKKSDSPYEADFDEAITAGQLGKKAMRQLSGMRNKIPETELYNIERFIGKSGDNRYGRERNRLNWQIKNFSKLAEGDDEVFQQPHFEKYAQDIFDLKEKLKNQNISQKDFDLKKQEMDKEFEKNKTTFLDTENNKEIRKQKQIYDEKIERLNKRHEKAKDKIVKLKLGNEEQQLQLETTYRQYKDVVEQTKEEYDRQKNYFKNRTAEQLLQDIKGRQEVVEKRHEKRKSLAQKAIDLHFIFKHFPSKDKNESENENESENKDEDESEKKDEGKSYIDAIDWINDAPFGTIKRAHRMLQRGISEDTVMELSVTDILCNQQDINCRNADEISKMIKKAKDDYETKKNLQSIIKISSILGRNNYSLSLEEMLKLSDLLYKNASNDRYIHENLSNALKEFSLDKVSSFLDKGCDLYKIITANEAYKKFGYDSNNQDFIEIALHNIDGLESAMGVFSIDEIKELLNDNVNLPVAVAVSENAQHSDYKLSILELSRIAKNIDRHGKKYFISALRDLEFSEVDKIFSNGINYSGFKEVRSALAGHGYELSFDEEVDLASKLSKENEYNNLKNVLDVFTLEDIGIMLDNLTRLNRVAQAKKALDEAKIVCGLNEIIEFAKYSEGSERVIKNTLEKFGVENTKKIVANKVLLDNALKVKKLVEDEKLPQMDNIDVIIGIARYGDNLEVVAKTIGAGFTLEEIIKYPSLVSPLVEKK